MQHFASLSKENRLPPYGCPALSVRKTVEESIDAYGRGQWMKERRKGSKELWDDREERRDEKMGENER